MKHFSTISFKSIFAFALIFMFTSMFFNAKAQLVGFNNKDAVSVKENNGVNHTNYQVLLTINTQELITAGKMKADGGDLRFALNCDGTTIFPHFIESGINTPNTKIWVKLNSLLANKSLTYYMFYGNAAALTTSNFAATFPKSKIITNPTVLTADSLAWNFDWIEIKAGATVTLANGYNKVFQMNARKVIIDGSIIGDGSGGAGGDGTTDEGGVGAGGGKNGSASGGGGGYGGKGGSGAWCCGDSATYAGAGGETYGSIDLITDIAAGSGGAGTFGGGVGGAGGAGVSISTAIFTMTGSISMNGAPGIVSGFYTGGGGSGGGILIKAGNITLSAAAKLSANGGNGGTPTGIGYDSGGAGGGRIKLFYQNTITNAGTMTVIEGAKGSGGVVEGTAGFVGTKYTGLTDIGEPDITITQGLNATLIIESNRMNICTNNPVTFTTIPGNGGALPTYQWKINGNDVMNETAATFTTTLLNNADKVTCSMVSNSNCTNNPTAISNEIQITVLAAVASDFSFSPSTSIPKGKSINFVSTSNNATSWSWEFGDGGTSTIANPAYAYNNPGTFLITLITSNGSCTDTVKKQITITNASVPIKANYTFTANQLTVTFNNTSDNATEFVWDFGDGEFSVEKNPVHTYATQGTFMVQLIANKSALSDTITKSITLSNSVVVAANFTFTTNELTASFTNSTANGITYAWSFGDGTGTSTQNNPSYTYTANGTYTVMLIATNGSVKDTVTKQVTVTKTAAVVVAANFNFNTNELNATFNNTTTNGITYEWTFGDGTGASTLENPSYTYTADGTYTVTLIATNGTVKDTITKNITVSKTAQVIVVADFTFTANELNASFTNNTSNGVTYAWSFGDGTGTSTQTSPSYTYLADGTYTVKLIATNGTVTDTISKSITVSKIVGINAKTNALSIYPNPATDLISIMGNMNFKNIKVIDMLGKTVIEYTYNLNNLDITNLPTGMYYLVANDKNNTYVSKFIKE